MIKKTEKLFTIASTVLITLLVVLVVGYFVGKWVLNTGYVREYYKDDFNSCVVQIQNSPPLPNVINDVFEKIYPYARENKIKDSYRDYVWKHIMGKYPRRKKGSTYYSLKTSELFNNNFNHRRNLLNPDLILAYGIEKHTSPSKCVDYYFNNVSVEIKNDSANAIKSLKGINDVSSYYFQKSTTDLSQDEVFKLLAVIEWRNKPKDELDGRVKLLKRLYEISLMRIKD